MLLCCFFFFFLIRQPSFPGMIRPLEQAPIHLPMDKVVAHSGHEVLMVDDLYFTDCWLSTRDFKPTIQALPNSLIENYYYINYL